MNGDVRTEGVSAALEPDGTQRLRIARIEVHDVDVRTAPGPVTAASATLSNVDARLGAAPPSAGSVARMRELRIGEVRLEGARIDLPVTRPPRAVGVPNGRWRLEPLSALDGSVRADITDAHWVFDADVTIPIDGGRLDFDRATVEHVGPDSSMGISPTGVYVDAPNGRTYLYLFSGTTVPGATFERRGAFFARRRGSRGAIELRPFVESVLSGAPMGALAAGIGDMLARTRFGADLRLGDGLVGDERQRVVLTGRDQGCNRIDVSSASGGQVVLRIHDLSIAESRMEMWGHVVATGPLTATLSVQVQRLAAAPVASVTVAALALRDLVWRAPQAADER